MLPHLREHFKAHADDNHAAPELVPCGRSPFLATFTSLSSPGKVLRLLSN